MDPTTEGLSSLSRASVDPTTEGLISLSSLSRVLVDPTIEGLRSPSRATVDPMLGVNRPSRATVDPMEGLNRLSRATVDPMGGLSRVFQDPTTAGLSSPNRATVDPTTAGLSRTRVLLRHMPVPTEGRRSPNRVSMAPTMTDSHSRSRALLEGPSRDTVVLKEGVRNLFRVTAAQIDPMEGHKNLNRVTVDLTEPSLDKQDQEVREALVSREDRVDRGTAEPPLTGSLPQALGSMVRPAGLLCRPRVCSPVAPGWTLRSVLEAAWTPVLRPAPAPLLGSTAAVSRAALTGAYPFP